MYRDVALKLGLTPVALDHPRNIAFASLSLPVREFVEISIPIALNGDIQRTVFRCHLLDVNHPNGAAEAYLGRTLSTMFFRGPQSNASGMVARRYPGSNEWVSPVRTHRPTVNAQAAVTSGEDFARSLAPAASAARGIPPAQTARRSRPFQRGGAALRSMSRAGRITHSGRTWREFSAGMPPPIYPKWNQPSLPINESKFRQAKIMWDPASFVKKPTPWSISRPAAPQQSNVLIVQEGEEGENGPEGDDKVDLVGAVDAEPNGSLGASFGLVLGPD